MTPRTAKQALGHIEAAGLISQTGCLTGGTVVWKLHLEIVKAGPSVAEQRNEQERKSAVERQRRYRQKLAGLAARRAIEDDAVTAAHAVTGEAAVTASHAVSHAATTVTTAGQPGYNCQ